MPAYPRSIPFIAGFAFILAGDFGAASQNPEITVRRQAGTWESQALPYKTRAEPEQREGPRRGISQLLGEAHT